MNEREQFIATLLYQQPDRIPFAPGGGRESTLAAWRRQGLPAQVQDPTTYIRQLLGIEPAPQHLDYTHHGVSFLMLPEFEEKIIERRPSPANAPPGQRGTLIVQDWKGNICEISDQFDPSYLRYAKDFVTRSWLRCPVESRKDWPDMARRYQAHQPGRFPDDFAARGNRLRHRTYVSSVVFPGPFWQLREWCGFEGLCTLIMDDPDFVLEMVRFWRDFVSAMFTRMFTHYIPDMVMFNEDMAYKEKPMIGPEQCRRFMMPCWRPWTEQCKAAGVPIVAIDSDGHVGELIPVWIEAGIAHNAPLEVAAGNDLPAFSKRFGKKMSYAGGVDKRAIAKGGQVIRDELARLRPTIKAGGYIPGCDHGVPSDVSWDNFVDYCRLLARETGWL